MTASPNKESSAENDAQPDDSGPEADGVSDESLQFGPSPEQQEEEIAKLKDQLLRAVAEQENMRRRFEREREETAKYAITGFARDLVNVIENLQRASETIGADARAQNELLKSLAEGVELTQNELINIFQRHGIKRIYPEGEKFDHHYHQAMAQVDGGGAPAGTIMQVLQAGYIIQDRLLRPALVTVAKTPEGSTSVDTKA